MNVKKVVKISMWQNERVNNDQVTFSVKSRKFYFGMLILGRRVVTLA